MSKSIIDDMNANNLEATLEYLFEQLENADTKQDVHAVLELARQLLERPTTHKAVHGLQNVRVEYDLPSSRPHTNDLHMIDADEDKLSNVVNLEVPHILTHTFQALSERMKALQNQDPDTFANASSALSWLANGELTGNNKH